MFVSSVIFATNAVDCFNGFRCDGDTVRVTAVLGFNGSADPNSGLGVEVFDLTGNVIPPEGAVGMRSKDGSDAI